MNVRKKVFHIMMTFVVMVTFLTTVMPLTVKAETVVTVVMTYEDKIFTKQLYSVDIDKIKNGEETEGFRSIGGLCDNLTFQTNGKVTVDKAAVMNVVKNEIILGKTSISLDLYKFTPEGIAQSAANVAALEAATGMKVPVPGTETANQVPSPVDAFSISNPVVAANLVAMGIDTKISEASTKFNPNLDRAVNVRNAASKINGMILQPGQAFSATVSFQPRTAANGYGLGDVLADGGHVKSMGGGICQVSSTLNLALLRAGIIPFERHNHSERSAYIASGLDATISGTALDYKFINPLMFPIYISTESSGGVLKVAIYSNHAALAGVTYEPNVVGGKMSNTTYVVGTLNGVVVSNRVAYSSKYSK